MLNLGGAQKPIVYYKEIEGKLSDSQSTPEKAITSNYQTGLKTRYKLQQFDQEFLLH